MKKENNTTNINENENDKDNNKLKFGSLTN